MGYVYCCIQQTVLPVLGGMGMVKFAFRDFLCDSEFKQWTEAIWHSGNWTRAIRIYP
jgi:hypothetical protein